MAEIRHYIDGRDLGEPRNWEELEITIDWLNKKESGAINVTDLEFVDEANEYLQKRIMDGMDGGVGVFEGVPYQIKVGDQDSPTFVFDGYLDATDEPILLGGEEIVLSLKKLGGDDWLNDVADGFSFAYLFEQGIIKNSDFIKVPYVINYIPDGTQLMIISLSVFMMSKETIESIEKLSDSIADVIDASTPVIGTAVVAGIGGVSVGIATSWDLGNFISVTLKALARLIYAIAMVLAIINLIDALFDQILQKKRNHLGMTFRRMCERACEHLGLQFISTIPELEWVHIPRKDRKGGSSGESGFPTNTEPIYTFGGLVRTLQEMFNADHRIKNNVFYLERKDGFRLPTSFQLPDYFNDQVRLLDKDTLNTDEIVANYNINWALDVQDQNTLENSTGRVFQAVTSPITIINPKMVSIKGLKEISIPFSMGLEKTTLTDVEKALKSLGSIVDGVTGIFGGGTNFKSKIESRIGSLLLSSHFTTNGKVVKMSGSRLANNQRAELDARRLWDGFHFINSFAEYQGRHNQFFREKDQPIPMEISELAMLLDSNQGTNQDGQDFEIEKVVMKPYYGTALIDYRLNKKYTNNLQIKFI